MAKVVVGMSGGVDSSVTAYLLKEQGHEVVGVSFMLWEARERTDFRTCCSLEAIGGAAETAKALGITHRVIDVRGDFIDKVIEPFVDAYLHGITPNPCVLCNLHIKFPYLLKEAERTGAEFISTGHYARVERIDGDCLLKKGIDPVKDQTYFLYVLNRDTLCRLLFPLGVYTKESVREIAGRLKLPAAQRPESVEICFIPEGDYPSFISNIVVEAVKSGPITGPDGSVLGTHKGIFNYTVGQRRGLNVSSAEPLYVIKIDTENNAIHVGSREMAFKREMRVGDLNWIAPPVNRVTAKIRSMMKDEAAVLLMEEGGDIVTLVFDEPQWAPAPGQAAVFYRGDVVLGGGIILRD
ncbi:tRNA-specific 2-thiouridylase MnmA [hydrothermal vent metagenome]|uniref:tRNA-specific 2-thiouridylase MnmA n=1 Tax=hydrothermal vent metagenome TaxID=652676 RepID=A0A3B1CIL2_9ZZZZ